MEKINFIFVWRLSVEKWFDLVLDLIQNIEKSELKDVLHLDIFWEWSLWENIWNHNFITYHWFQPKEKLFETRKKCHYSLMPSKFLETFGLSALDSLTLWVPIVWYKKWGLQQFGDWITHIPEWEELFSHIQKIVENHNQTDYDNLSKVCRGIAFLYTRDNRKKQFERCLWKPIQWSKILLISDYLNNVWGIESYLEIISGKLRGFGSNQVSRVWIEIPNKKWLRYLLMPLSLHNFITKNQLKRLLKNNKYDLIWRHSVQRLIWPTPIKFVGKNTNTKQWLMIHDFGLIHPFPSQVHSQEQFIDSNNLSQRMQAGFERFQNNIFKKILRFVPLFLKWWSGRLIKNQIAKNIDVVLVPSKYMIPIIEKNIPLKNSVKTLSHVI